MPGAGNAATLKKGGGGILLSIEYLLVSARPPTPIPNSPQKEKNDTTSRLGGFPPKILMSSILGHAESIC